jgi:hypothetical protein
LIIQGSAKKLEITILNFFFGELTITINIHGSENFINWLLLLLSE